MEPLNKKERANSKARFLALFVIGILIVLVPFYFLVRLPEKTGAITSDELTSLQNQLKFQKEDFTVKLDSVINMLGQFNTPNVDVDKLNADIGSVLSEMEKSISGPVISSTGMYKSVISVLVELKKLKNAELKNTAELQKVKKELEECKKELEPSDSLEH
jgi:uncharacterized membrane-anchored protein YhcB (DUF1043 family)